MNGSGIRVGRILGIEVSIDRSWFVIAFLIAWSFYLLFEAAFPSLSAAASVILGTATAILFFGSVVVHEVSHSVVARAMGMEVEGISLFIFGGVTKAQQESRSPREEFAVAIVGPVTSLVLALCFWALVNLTGDVFPEVVRYAFGHLGWLNLALGVFNLLPGFPLDGGRVLRSIVWHTTGSMERATRTAARGGKALAWILIAFGFLEVFGGNLVGLWYAAIGWFLYQAAAVSGQQTIIRHLLEGLAAADLMSPHLIVVPADATIEEAVDHYFLRYDHSAFPVVDEEGHTKGVLTLRAVRQLDRDQWPVRQAWATMTKIDETATVTAETPAQEVVAVLEDSEHQRVLVVENGQVMGIITPRDIARWVRRSEELGLTGES